MIQITFLNMLIAIMGDTFEKAIEQRENNARLTKLKIMGDYTNLIVRTDRECESEKHPFLNWFNDMVRSFKGTSRF